MSGNLINNYNIKAECAGKAMSKNAKLFFNIKEDYKFFSKIYIETSGMNSLKQFKIAFKKLTKTKNISEEILKKTEIDFRKNLDLKENKIKLFDDAKNFLKSNNNDYIFVISTTVPIDNIPKLIKKTKLNNYINFICARDGILENKKIKKIKNFDKGEKHFNYILKRFNQSKKNLIVISSTNSDIIISLKNNITSIAIKKIFNKKELEKLNPNYILNNFDELKKLLNQIKN